MSEGLDWLTIAGFTLAFFITLTLVGDSIRVLIGKLWRVPHEKRSIFEVMNFDISLATAVIPIFTLLLTWSGRWLNVYAVYSFILVAVLGRIYMLKREGFLSLTKIRKSIMESFSLHLHSSTVIFAVAFFVVVLLRLCLTVGLFVYPADDAKMHSLHALMVVENNGYPVDWGHYAPEPFLGSPVCYMLGFHSICAFFHFLTGVPIERCVLVITNLYNGLISLSMFYLASRIFNNRYVGILSALFTGLVSRQPLYFLSWGGNAEQVADYLLPTFLGLYYEPASSDDYSVEGLVISTFVLTGMFYIHYLSVCYALCCIAPYFLYKLITKRRLKIALYTFLMLSVPLLLSLPMLITPIIVNLAPEKLRVLEDLAYLWWREKQVLGAERVFSYKCIYAFWSVFEGQFGLVLTFFSFFGILLLLLRIKKRTSEGIYLLGWLFLLFAIFENGPYGLYFIRFPVWYNLLPDRFFLTMSMPLSCLAGFCSYNLIGVKNEMEGPPKRIMKLILEGRVWKFFGIFIIIMVFAFQALSNFVYMYQLRSLSAVTKEDYEAFMWIRENIPENTTFYATEADAGQWISVVTQRRTFPPFVHQSERFYTQEFLWENGVFVTLMHINPDNSSTMALLSKYKIDYVYIGQKSIFNRARLDPNLLLNSIHYRLIYHPEGTEVYIFRVVY